MKKKLTCVLFVPIVHGVHEQPVIGSAFLWRPTIEQEAVLRADWEDLSDLVSQGLGFAVRATRGRSLQLRPKASSSRDVRTARVDGEDVVVKPQGFYLRPSFTVALLREAVLLA